jgi:hypothetical protein
VLVATVGAVLVGVELAGVDAVAVGSDVTGEAWWPPLETTMATTAAIAPNATAIG